jgi:hypothetical protein
MSQEPIVITGEENIGAAQALATLHYWRMTATNVTRFKGRPRAGWTITAFRKMYGLPIASVRTWDDVATIVTETLEEIRKEAAK